MKLKLRSNIHQINQDQRNP